MSEKARVLSFWIITSDFYFTLWWVYVQDKKFTLWIADLGKRENMVPWINLIAHLKWLQGMTFKWEEIFE